MPRDEWAKLRIQRIARNAMWSGTALYCKKKKRRQRKGKKSNKLAAKPISDLVKAISKKPSPRTPQSELNRRDNARRKTQSLGSCLGPACLSVDKEKRISPLGRFVSKSKLH